MDTTLLSLPVEIQRQCVNYLDTAALKSTRLTSQALKAIATEALFQVATLQFTEESADRFTTLIKNDQIRLYIRELHLDFDCDEEGTYDECSSTPPPKWWTEAVAGWGGIALPNLKKLMVDSAYACADSDCASLELAFTTFLSCADISTLTIKHFQDACQVQRPDIAQLPTIPKKLHLLITPWTSYASSEYDLEVHHRHALFNVHLNASWLTPMQTQLTHLTLHCNTFWGLYPRWHPNHLHFPQLKSLAFGKWTIAYDWQIDFIISHGQTLEQLILINCPILHASRLTHRQLNNAWHLPLGGTPRGRPPTDNFFSALRWHTILPEFQTKLPKLKHFSMGRGPIGETDWFRRMFSGDEAFEDRYSLTPCIDSSRYAIFDYGDGPVEWQEPDIERGWYKKAGWEKLPWSDDEIDEDLKRNVQYPDCLQEDQEALVDLLRTIKGKC